MDDDEIASEGCQTEPARVAPRIGCQREGHRASQGGGVQSQHDSLYWHPPRVHRLGSRVWTGAPGAQPRRHAMRWALVLLTLARATGLILKSSGWPSDC